MELYGQLDLTTLGDLVRKHKDLVKHVQFKDGEHMLLDISVYTMQQEDRFHNTETIKVKCNKSEQKEGLRYYIGNLKRGGQKKEQIQQPAEDDDEQQFYQPPVNPNDLPF